MIRALLLLLTALPRLLSQADPATPCIVIEEGTQRWLYASVQVYDLSTLEVIVWLNSGLHDGTFHIQVPSGDYGFYIRRYGMAPVELAPVTVTAGQPLVLAITLRSP